MVDEEEQEESGQLAAVRVRETEDFDDDIERSPEIVDLNAVRANDDGPDLDAHNTTNNSDGLRFKMQKVTDKSYEIASDMGKQDTSPRKTLKTDTELTTPKLR